MTIFFARARQIFRARQLRKPKNKSSKTRARKTELCEFAKSCTRAENFSCATSCTQKKVSKLVHENLQLHKFAKKLHASGKCFVHDTSQTKKVSKLVHENLNFERFEKSCTRAENVSCATSRKQKKSFEMRARKFAQPVTTTLQSVPTPRGARDEQRFRARKFGSFQKVARELKNISCATHKKFSELVHENFCNFTRLQKVARAQNLQAKGRKSSSRSEKNDASPKVDDVLNG
jgi:hypothetical protein